MKILSRRVSTSKSPEEIMHILQTAAYSGRDATFDETAFSMYCLKKRAFQYRATVLVKGKIIEPENGVVLLEIQARPYYFLTSFMWFMFVLGCIHAVYRLICDGMQGLETLGIMILGLLFSAQPLWDGIEILDRLEDKLTQG